MDPIPWRASAVHPAGARKSFFLTAGWLHSVGAWPVPGKHDITALVAMVICCKRTQGNELKGVPRRSHWWMSVVALNEQACGVAMPACQ